MAASATRLNNFSLSYGGTRLYFGQGVASSHLAEHLHGAKRALIITSKSAARVSGALDHITRSLNEKQVEYVIYDNVKSNPTTANVDDAVRVGRDAGADLVIGIGGGSVIDVAKTVSILLRTDRSATDYVKGVSRSSVIGVPLIVVNLTHGTGSEIDKYVVLTIEGTIEKRGFVARYPDVSFDDPAYTVTLTREQTIYTSLDAFYHAYESVTSRFSNHFTEALGQDAVERIKNNLPNVLENPRSIIGRWNLLYASMEAGICIDQSMTHLNHAIEHAFSGINPVLPHGAGLAMLGPRVVYYTHKANPEASWVVLRHLDPRLRPVSDDAERAMRAVEEFQKSVGFSSRLSDYGIGEDDIRIAVEFIMRMIRERYRSVPFEPTPDVIVDIIKHAL